MRLRSRNKTVLALRRFAIGLGKLIELILSVHVIPNKMKI